MYYYIYMVICILEMGINVAAASVMGNMISYAMWYIYVSLCIEYVVHFVECKYTYVHITPLM